MVQRRKIDRPVFYRIKLKGMLDKKWSDWLGGFTFEHVDGNTMLTGIVVDQPSLYGLLTRIRDLNLPLIMLERVENDE